MQTHAGLRPGAFALAPRFPGRRFADFASWEAYRQQSQPELDARYAYELEKATREPQLQQPGSCAPCLRAARFTSSTEGGTRLQDGSLLPAWREAQICDCAAALNNRSRALLHFIQTGGLLPNAEALWLGPADGCIARLAALAGRVHHAPQAAGIAAAGLHLVASAEHLHTEPELPAALARVQAALLPGGRLVFTVPFNAAAAQSGAAPGQAWLGWEVLDMLRAAGFREAAAWHVWSEELGYLGPDNFIFRAVR